jgi:hypothetical protein
MLGKPQPIVNHDPDILEGRVMQHHVERPDHVRDGHEELDIRETNM